MKSQLFTIGALSLCFVNTGCAANSGGHVVGNPIISESTAKKASKDLEKDLDKACDCTVKDPKLKKTAKTSSDCDCSKKEKKKDEK
ncbi:MAG TPA: hypothetical protein VIH99_08370 [Bdellovibrionota bacterium]|jgi:hypothetical protein